MYHKKLIETTSTVTMSQDKYKFLAGIIYKNCNSTSKYSHACWASNLGLQINTIITHTLIKYPKILSSLEEAAIKLLTAVTSTYPKQGHFGGVSQDVCHLGLWFLWLWCRTGRWGNRGRHHGGSTSRGRWFIRLMYNSSTSFAGLLHLQGPDNTLLTFA